MESLWLVVLLILRYFGLSYSVTMPVGTKIFSLEGPTFLPNHPQTPDGQTYYIPDVEVEFDVIYHGKLLAMSVSDSKLFGIGAPHDYQYRYPMLRIEERAGVSGQIGLSWTDVSNPASNRFEYDFAGNPPSYILPVEQTTHIYFRCTQCYVYFEADGVELLNATHTAYNSTSADLMSKWNFYVGGDGMRPPTNATVSNFAFNYGETITVLVSVESRVDLDVDVINDKVEEAVAGEYGDGYDIDVSLVDDEAEPQTEETKNSRFEEKLVLILIIVAVVVILLLIICLLNGAYCLKKGGNSSIMIQTMEAPAAAASVGQLSSISDADRNKLMRVASFSEPGAADCNDGDHGNMQDEGDEETNQLEGNGNAVQVIYANAFINNVCNDEIINETERDKGVALTSDDIDNITFL